MLSDNRLYQTTVITGLGRSGTTFLAHVFYNAGYDLAIDPSSIGYNIPNGGFELANVSGISRQGHTQLLEQYPTVIKDPTFAYHLDNWLRLGQIPKHAIFMQRNIDACYQSHLRHIPNTNKSNLCKIWKCSIDNIKQCKIPYTIVPFPEIAINSKLSYLLEPWIDDPFIFLKSTFDASKVHH